MTKKFLKLSVFFAALVIICGSCSKDDNNSFISNPLNGKTTALFNSNVTYGSMTDQDSNVYKTVTIGTQTWMAENLRTKKYNDGRAIPNVTDHAAWLHLTTDAYCNYNNITNDDTIATFGLLYNWYAVNTGRLAPDGWHIATDADWTQLTDYLGGESVAGGILKETGTLHWYSPNEGATNETGFTALPAGGRDADGTLFYNIGSYSYWWSSSEYSSTNAWFRFLFFDGSNVGRYSGSKKDGFAVRCVKD
jgi:uncharacterized protein (TIGR02145 family)